MRYALGGGFGGTEMQEWEECHSTTEESATEEAYEMACDEYDSYDGMHGLRDTSMIMEEDEIADEDEAYEVWKEERESWLDYEVRVKEPATI